MTFIINKLEDTKTIEKIYLNMDRRFLYNRNYCFNLNMVSHFMHVTNPWAKHLHISNDVCEFKLLKQLDTCTTKCQLDQEIANAGKLHTFEFHIIQIYS